MGRWHDPAGAPSWVPPVTQPPPGQWDAPYGAPQYGAIPPPQTRPYPSFGQPPPPPPPRGRVPGWTWPVVCVLALVLGLVGGAFGSLLLERLTDDTPGLVSGGLDDVDTVTAAPLPDDNGSVAAVAQQLLPSTVQISAEYQGQKGGATGSGFVLDRQGHVITNNHVVADAAKDDGPIEIVDQDGNRYEAEVVGRSPVYDLAVLYVQGRPQPAAGIARQLARAARRRPGRRLRLAARTELHRHGGHRERPRPSGHHRRLRERLLVHQRRADRCRHQPRQLRRTRWSTSGARWSA